MKIDVAIVITSAIAVMLAGYFIGLVTRLMM